jgi:NitT/TauT family transport system substrate-binding protein
MKNLKSLALIGALLAAPAGLFAEKVTVAWSVWTGWMPFKVMQTEGLLAKRAAELGVEVELKEFKEYMASVQAFSARQVDGCTMTSMEALQPASGGVRTIAVLPNDVSNGGDGVLVRKGMTIADLKGKEILLEQFSVSHYLLGRALERGGLTEADVTIKNITGDEAGKAFLTDDSVTAVATWNPHLFLAQESGKGEVVFSSKDISGEIIDLLVFNAETVEKNPAAVEAVVLAWYDAMDLLSDKATRDKTIATMADGAGSSPQEFRKMMAGTRFFPKPEDGLAFFRDPSLVSTMSLIRGFSFKNELITDANFEIGFDAASKAPLVFSSAFLEKAIARRAPAKVLPIPPAVQ